jgi:hypothetical protein
VLNHLAISAYGWTNRRSIDWGAGGPEYWPDARPYFTPANSQDQLGFRIYQWYQAVAQAVLQRPCPVFLLQAGLPSHPDRVKENELSSAEQTSVMKEVFTWATGKDLTAEKTPENLPPPELDLPEEVEACCFWLLATDRGNRYQNQAWFQDGRSNLPISEMIVKDFPAPIAEDFINPTISNDKVFKRIQHPISHYILLANGQHGSWEQQLARMLPFVSQYHPTIGFSIDEAALAGKITILGKSPQITAETINRLTRSGCEVEQIAEDGTILA